MTDRSLAIQRERPMDLAEDWDRTGLRWVQCQILCVNWVHYRILRFTAIRFSTILIYSCDYDLWQAAKARSERTDLADDDNEAVTVLLLRRDRWVCIQLAPLLRDDLTR